MYSVYAMTNKVFVKPEKNFLQYLKDYRLISLRTVVLCINSKLSCSIMEEPVQDMTTADMVRCTISQDDWYCDIVLLGCKTLNNLHHFCL